MILTVRFEEVPFASDAERLQVEALVAGYWKVQVRYGFKGEPAIPKALRLCMRSGLTVDEAAISYFLSREIVVPTIFWALTVVVTLKYVALIPRATALAGLKTSFIV